MCTGAASDGDLSRLREALVDNAGDPRLVAVGEIGLDHFIAGLDRERQVKFYVAQLELAAEFGLPVLLHVRRAIDTVLKHLRLVPVAGGIAHAFNGSEQQADAFVELGMKLGFGGALTFDRALRIRRVAAVVPEQAIVMETDSPDIAPQWLYETAEARAAGATMRNDSSELPRIGAVLAQLRGVSASALAAATDRRTRSPACRSWRCCRARKHSERRGEGGRLARGDDVPSRAVSATCIWARRGSRARCACRTRSASSSSTCAA